MGKFPLPRAGKSLVQCWLNQRDSFPTLSQLALDIVASHVDRLRKSFQSGRAEPRATTTLDVIIVTTDVGRSAESQAMATFSLYITLGWLHFDSVSLTTPWARWWAEQTRPGLVPCKQSNGFQQMKIGNMRLVLFESRQSNQPLR